ncbi:hypothetical protein [Saccharothrix longispora]|uniref:hypothetical protein n=1 Tax=Saccharothrix longispora TaxID=33920 RepID=UPI0028FD7C2E|nr:hypothetical protein [Saccharothrix longispora]MDU0288594.1 hypothetical protein [Saccharothrix longispora]
MRVTRGRTLVVGDWPELPERTALVEAAGAVLAWDVLVDGPPAARVDDPERAADWLWEVYGDAAADVLGGADEVDVPVGGDLPVRDACRVLAQLTWARAWWPASAAAGVPALDPVLLAAERAVATSAAEHLLDDPDATARAVAEVVGDVPDPGLALRVAELAEDCGVVRDPAPTRSSHALAAGVTGPRAGVTVLSGLFPVDWALVPQGAVDAAAPVEWAVVRRQGGTFLDVTVVAGPGRTRLAARFAGVDVPLDSTDDLGRVTGSAPVPASLLLLPADRRVPAVYAPGFAEPAPPAPDAEERRAAILAYARSRAGSPTATLTERAAR